MSAGYVSIPSTDPDLEPSTNTVAGSISSDR